MLGIKEIGIYIPENFVHASELAVKCGESEDFASQRLGTEILPRMNEGEVTSDIATNALQDLLKKTSLSREDIDCIVVCTQNPDAEGLPHTSAIVHSKAGLSSSCAAFDISLGCSGYVYGLNVVKGFMESSGLKNGVLITADPYSKSLDVNDKNTVMLFGDAATATLISHKPLYEIKESIYATDGSKASFLEKKEFINMNGRQIFNFVQKEIPNQISELLEKSKLTTEDIDLLILHQASKHMLNTLVKRIGVDSEKVPVRLSKTGNTVSSSIPIVLEELLHKNFNQLLISGFGVGLSSGSMILHRVNLNKE